MTSKRFWLVLQEPGRVPERKGPWSTGMAAVLREFMEARPTAYIHVLTINEDGEPQIDHGPETLQILDGRSMGTGRKHNERVREAHTAIPRDVREQVLSMGRVEWGATDRLTSEGHLAHLEETLRITREHFNFEDVPVPMHGLYLEGTGTVLCHTGTSPNSGPNAQALVGAWNWLHEQSSASADTRPEGGDSTQIEAPFTSGAVPKADAQ